MTEIALLAAVGRRQLLEVLRLAQKQPFAVFGTLDGQAMGRINEAGGPAAGREVRVYLYETG